MPNLNCIFRYTSFLIIILVSSCNKATLDQEPVQQNTVARTNSEAQKFFEVHGLGKAITTTQEFDDLLSFLPRGRDKPGPFSNSPRVYLARIDDFPLGGGYSTLNKWDMALETGFIDGLLDYELTISEKLDHVNPRDPSEYIGTSPEDAFYMHGINLEDLNLIRKDVNAPTLLTYQIMDFSENDLMVVVYIRIIDIKSMKVMSSGLIKVGDNVTLPAEKEINAFNDAFEIVKNINDLPSSVFNKGVNVGLLNSDILNISGEYNKNPPSKKAMAIENGLITGLIHNKKYNRNQPVIIEKTSGFKLKYPAVYNSIVFNTSPVLYEEWSEFLSETKCNILMAYRYIPDNGVSIKFIDTKSNGKIIYARAFTFADKDDKGIIENHKVVSELFKSKVNIGLLKKKKVLILDGDKQAVESQSYFDNQPSFNEMNLAIEEGMISSLVDEKISIYEKLKTLYLKRPWMYNEKIFNLNPLYLDEWTQLAEFGVERLVVYNNLIPYEQLTSTSPDYKKVAIGVRIIDVNTGDILDVAELTNLDDSKVVEDQADDEIVGEEENVEE